MPSAEMKPPWICVVKPFYLAENDGSATCQVNIHEDINLTGGIFKNYEVVSVCARVCVRTHLHVFLQRHKYSCVLFMWGNEVGEPSIIP